jgi:hypothetical protein
LKKLLCGVLRNFFKSCFVVFCATFSKVALWCFAQLFQKLLKCPAIK